MDLADLASVGSFVSGVAVVISLLYLSVQIRQNTKHTRALIQQGRAARVSEHTFRLAELNADGRLDKCFAGSTDVSARDIRLFLAVARGMFISAEDSFIQSRQGLLDDIALQSFEASFQGPSQSRGLVAAWKLTRSSFEPVFQAYMDKKFSGDTSAPRDIKALWTQAVGELSANTESA